MSNWRFFNGIQSVVCCYTLLIIYSQVMIMTEWISHRGFCGTIEEPIATENTAAAFLAAISHGFEHLETDLRVSRDGHIVLCHDPDLRRISGRQVAVQDMTRKELSNERLRHGESLLFFDEFLEHFSHLRWILDIKPETAEQTVAQLNRWRSDAAVDRFLRENTRYLFWDSMHEQQLTSELPEAFCLAREGACYRAGVASLLGMPALGAIESGQFYAVPPTFKGIPLLSESLVTRFHARKAKVIGYLPESPEEHERALKSGVDQLLTNHADLKYLLTE